MLPQIQVQQPRRQRPRPINPGDTAATTGLAINPNGTYVANPYPTTAAIGATGGFGAMLPQVNMGTPDFTLQNRSGQFASPTFTPTTNTPYSPSASTFPMLTPSANAFTVRNGQTVSPTISTAGNNLGGFTPGRFSQAAMTSHIQQARDNPSYLNSLSPETRSAVLRMMGVEPAKPGGWTPGTSIANNEFLNTKFMQKNIEEGVSFVNQLRWDPTSGKYVKIGDLLKQGKLDIRGGGGNSDAQRRRARQRNRAREARADWSNRNMSRGVNDGYTLSNSFVQFNTATG